MPAGQLNAESWVLLKVLDDGQWHDYEAAIAQAIPQVAPGRALRCWNGTRRTENRTFAEPTEDEKIASGSRSLIMQSLNSLKKRYLEFQLNDEGVRTHIRRRAETIPVKAQPLQLLPDEKAALKQGEAYLPDPAELPGLPAAAPAVADHGAVMGEQAWRALVREEVESVLAGMLSKEIAGILNSGLENFQKGLQSFLVMRFAMVEGSIEEALLAVYETAKAGQQSGQQSHHGGEGKRWSRGPR